MKGGRAVELDGLLLKVAEQRLETVHGEFRAHVFRNLASRELALALVRGAVATPDPLLSRVHSSCVTSEAFGACDCDCAEQLNAGLEEIAKQSRGVLFYLMQEGRGAGLTAKARDRMLVQASREHLSTFEAYDRLGIAPDRRRYDDVSTLCRVLGIEAPLELLTNNPGKVSLLEREKVRISSTRPLQRATSPFNRHYLQAKQRSGHALQGLEGEGERAEWPEPVAWFEPTTLPDRSKVVYSASYWLPVRTDSTGASAWFRLHLYYDLSSQSACGAERVVLSYGSPSRDGPLLLRVQPERVLDRFPVRTAALAGSWRRAVRAFVERGAGVAVFLPSRLGERGPGRPQLVEEIDDVTLSLAAHHAAGWRCRLVCDPASADLDSAASVGLARAGLGLDPPLHLVE